MDTSAGVSRLLRAVAPHAWFLEDEVAGLAEFVGPGSVCVDVGAEFGLYTWTLAGLVGPEGHVHAVEPQPGPARVLGVVRGLLRTDRVTVHRLALGAEGGTGLLSVPRRRLLPVHGRAFLTTGAVGLGSNAEFAHHEYVPVEVGTLDELVAELAPSRLDLVKVDIEGAEATLLAGARKTLESFRPVVMLELEDRHLGRFDTSVSEIVDDLAVRGYAPWTWHGRWVPREADDGRRNVLFHSVERAPDAPPPLLHRI